MHLSRLSEDLIIYYSPGYNFLSFSDKVTTGSSLMPHKKNPDPVELVRASFGEAISSYIFLASLLKGLPTSYNRDLQLDKKALFGSYSVAVKVLSVMSLLINEMSLNEEVLSQLLSDEKLYLTDISEELIRYGLSWKEAHERVGQLLKAAEGKGTSVKELDKALIKKILGMDLNLDRFFNPYNSVKSKATYGSTNPKFVGRQLKRWQDRLSKEKGKDA
jgi:argininosuccinate lyase